MTRKMKDKRIQELEKLYANKSRHSQYQTLASNIESLIPDSKPDEYKYEKERIAYIKKKLNLSEAKVLDIGGNTGYFTFEACNLNSERVDYYEGNIEHAKFVELASQVVSLDNIIDVHSEYFLFEKREEKWDFAFFLNVVHHLGFDFEQDVPMDVVKDRMIMHINEMSYYCKRMAFQMGFNWCGNIEKCLFENGTKSEMEEYIKEGTSDFWEIEHIGIPEMKNNVVEYYDRSEENNVRIDYLGEFLNRPLFIMKSKKV